MQTLLPLVVLYISFSALLEIVPLVAVTLIELLTVLVQGKVIVQGPSILKSVFYTNY